jgi:hypothetical protein
MCQVRRPAGREGLLHYVYRWRHRVVRLLLDATSLTAQRLSRGDDLRPRVSFISRGADVILGCALLSSTTTTPTKNLYKSRTCADTVMAGRRGIVKAQAAAPNL